MAGNEQDQTEKHYVQFSTVAVGRLNLMIGKNERGELTGDYMILDSRTGEESLVGQRPFNREIMTAYQLGERQREALKAPTNPTV